MFLVDNMSLDEQIFVHPSHYLGQYQPNINMILGRFYLVIKVCAHEPD